jgi:hypothetical protein
MKTRFLAPLALLPFLFAAAPLGAADNPLLEEEDLQGQIRALTAETSGSDRLQKAHRIVHAHRLSSMQVKAIAAKLSDDTARFEFALAAYPLTVDPENFYEVYDAFSSFSKVIRLHDGIRDLRRPPPPPLVPGPRIVTDDDLKGMLKALRTESFDQTRIRVARQILSTSQRQFLSRQIKQMLDCFDFENNKLELAKFAYDFVADRELYFSVNEAFDFDATKQSLARHIESRTQAPKPPPHR